MRVKTWKVLDRGAVPSDARRVQYTCTFCGREAELPVVGTPIAQIEQGIVFDTDRRGIMPPVIQCRKCRRIFEGASVR
jgi:hypothetical protein